MPEVLTVFETVTVVVVDCDRTTTALQSNIKKQNAKGKRDPTRSTFIATPNLQLRIGQLQHLAQHPAPWIADAPVAKVQRIG